MTDDHQIFTLLDKITLASSDQELLRLLSDLSPRAARKPVRLAFVNAHALNMCYRDPEFLSDLLACDYILRDGSGMKILLSMLGRDAGLNLNGTDLIPRIIELYAGEGAMLLGTEEPYLGKAAASFSGRGVKPAVKLDGFRPDATYVEAARPQSAKLIVLGMGMPKQERVARLLAAELGRPCLIICGGAILDFLGEKVRRAPPLFRRFGMEWLYRLGREPRRLFGRYVIGNFIFLARTGRLAARSRLSARTRSKTASAQ